ncbi:hypothetical protein HLH26_10070 [Gluconacetobacter sp. 1b LMG 1731]|uniref:DUF2946 domain-containing protein n=1 Tax=Gluconacetobacter dulcium TaxID=2729096 RepID=A0A7W4K1B5_9PROT|nr:hypothetical protein [Gluconacetobacter dulcium]MBB2164879.1 hypothetical protein [Gluconacetobacter dulcium]MBB2194058.1 hypothetical protein [Gluconacetobacter dulcium]MBB2198498.1 hypothetical protein [Gluconacetobacter dulcium]
MVRTHARISTGLLVCLLMQVWLLVGFVPAHADAPPVMHHHGATMVTHHCTDMNHSDKCCHVHAASADLSPPVTILPAELQPEMRRQPFVAYSLAVPPSTDGMPSFRPPKIRAV